MIIHSAGWDFSKSRNLDTALLHKQEYFAAKAKRVVKNVLGNTFEVRKVSTQKSGRGFWCGTH